MKLHSLRDLDIFKHIVDGGSLRAAARALNLSPAVVSRRIRALEKALGTPLLLRSTRSLQVTPSGERFYKRCVAILNQAREAEAEASPGSDALQGVLRVSMPTGFALPGFLGRVGAFLDANPALELELYVSDHPVDARAAGMDAVIRAGVQPDSTLLSRSVGMVQMQIVATPRYLAAHGVPDHPNDLLNHRCLRFRADRQQDLWRLIDEYGVEHDVRVGGHLFCDSSAALTQALYADLGIGFHEASISRVAIERGELVHVLPAYRTAPFALHATYPRENRTSPPMNAFLALVSDFLSDPARVFQRSSPRATSSPGP